MKNKLIITLFASILTAMGLKAQNLPEKFEENSKYGLRINGKNVVPAIYDDVSTDFLVIAKKGNGFDLYNNKLILLDQNIKAYEYFIPMDIFQIITKKNEIKTFNNKGQQIDTSKLKIESQKDLFIKNDRALENYTITNNGVKYERKEYFGKENYPREFNYKIIKNGKDARFVNNKKSLEISSFYNPNITDYFEKTSSPDYTEETLYTPLKHTYIILKINEKYGVWDFKEQKEIITFQYKRIIPYQNYLSLEKDELSTFYPNIGIEPKYKKLEPYTGAFARFETPDGKKGWVDRRGKEYFDQ
ncbi:hypothetical protein N0B40_14735 [Chryseobacterium oranimense]|uniref:hypothetical protein n=1 Tax=Chryseobacterium oranimense TaxID=421058 RepID=UPI0021B03105|nr:hypothetical protein [Chryseobacterium oranimense]UWX59664.1 hypothetical protein N0B40_14735 [Chryseobacterium oranimense]